MRKWLLAAILSLGLAGNKSTLDVKPAMCMAPCKIEAHVKVVPDEGDRWFELTVDDNANFYQFESGPIPDRTMIYAYKLPYPGEYVVKLDILDSTAHVTYSITRKVEVNGE